jgi:gamma-glutamyltranspeptidase / glutathione hydrolase
MSGFTTRPVITGRRGIVTSGHYLAAHAGMRMLEAGGNAIDAGVAAGFALNVLEPHNCGIAGEAPILIHHARSGRTVAISGQGTAPAAMTLEALRAKGIRLIPGDGLLGATVPAAPDAWITALEQFGTLPLATVLAPALELAEEGFALNPNLCKSIANSEKRFREEWPGSADIYLPEGHAPKPGDRLRQADWARSMRHLVTAEQQAAGRGRSAGLQAARDAFYRGPIAERIAAFVRETPVRDASGTAQTGFLAYEDLANYRSRVEAPVSIDYRGLQVHKCGPWNQGPVFLQQLALLQGYDLKAMGPNTTDYIHTVVECAKLAFADREFYYGDPEFVKVPLDRLLSHGYAEERCRLVDPAHASLALRPGNAGPRPSRLILGDLEIDASLPTHADGYVGDTTHLDVVDAEGNLMAATVSGAWIPSSPVVPGLGFPLGTRGQMFSLDPEHPNVVQPGKRPRTTLTPSLVTRGGQPWLAFGTPGGDQQDQWTLQFFLNVVEFGMDLQAAIDAPTFHSLHFPSSFYPRAQYPGRLVVENRIPPETRAALEARGHEIVVIDDWGQGGRVMGVAWDGATGFLRGAASPRNETAYTAGW